MKPHRLALVSLPLILALVATDAQAQLWAASTGFTPEQTCVPWVASVGGGAASPAISSTTMTIVTNACAERVSYDLREPDISLSGTVWIEARLRVSSGAACQGALRRTVVLSISPVPEFGQLVQIGPGELITTASANGSGTEYLSGQVSLDTSVFHDYRLEVDPAGVSTVFVDGIPRITTTISYNPSNHGQVPRVFFGQGSTFSHGVSEWESFDTNAAMPLRVELRQDVAGGAVTVCNTGLLTGHEYRNLFNFELCAGGPGSGPLLGLCATTPQSLLNLQSQLLLPPGTPPFRYAATGRWAAWGPFSAPPLTVDVLCLDLTGGVLNGASPVVRAVVQ